MKKIFTISFMLCLALTICAQGNNKVSASEPEFLPEFNFNGMMVTGVSNDGRYIYGVSQSGSACIFDLQKTSEPMTIIEAGPEDYFGVSVAGITSDGKALVSHYLHTYFLNLEDGSKEELESPNINYGLDAWCMSADGKYIGCNLTTEDYQVYPMLAEKQEDGTYKMIYLDYDENDAMGCLAQYTQVRFINDNGNYVIGIQPDNRGMGGRLIVWERQEDGSYKFTTPMDDFIYDLSIEKPGLAPEWYDYVTADPDTDPELFQQQSNAFDEAFNNYEKIYNDFTRNNSNLEIYMMNKAVRNDIICLAFYDNRVNPDYNLIPVFYNFATKEITSFPEMTNSIAINALPEDGLITATDNGGMWSLTAIDKDGNKQPFEEWLMEKTDVDIAKDFTFSFYDYMNDQEITGVFPGLPYFSNDGKTLVFTGTDEDAAYFAAFMNFGEDLFATTTGISANTTNDVTVNNGKIVLGAGVQGVAEVYSLSGAKCGTYAVNGTFDFNTILSKGAYIARLNVEGNEPISIKIIVK